MLKRLINYLDMIITARKLFAISALLSLTGRIFRMVQRPIDCEDHFPCLLHFTLVKTKVLLTDTLKDEYIGFSSCVYLVFGALLGPVKGEVIFSIFKYFQFSIAAMSHSLIDAMAKMKIVIECLDGEYVIGSGKREHLGPKSFWVKDTIRKRTV